MSFATVAIASAAATVSGSIKRAQERHAAGLPPEPLLPPPEPERRRFTTDDTTAAALTGYAIGLAMYPSHDTSHDTSNTCSASDFSSGGGGDFGGGGADGSF
jgi:uncharacterized membrane protein YgcG